MNEILIRFKVVKSGKYLEVLLDDRLSFKDNFELLKNILDINIDNVRVYDPLNEEFLDRNTCLKEFNIKRFMTFYLF